jgi:hypothetical protein
MSENPANRTTTETLVLKDASGGLNTRDFPGALKANEFSQLVNRYTDEGGYPGKKVPGGQSIMNSPPDPVRYVTDYTTLALWHLTEAAFPYADSSANARDFTQQFGLHAPAVAQGLFGNAEQMYPVGINAGTIVSNGGFLILPYGGGGSFLEGLIQVTFEAWIKVEPNFTGQPYPDPNGGPAISQGGGIIAGSYNPTTGAVVNGLTLERDWNATANAPASAPYVKLTIQTQGAVGKQINVLVGNEMTPGHSYHVQGTYNNMTGLATLAIDSSVQAQQAVGGASAGHSVVYVDDTGALGVCVGGKIVAGTPAGYTYMSLPGIFSEVRISSTSRLGTYPFQIPHGSMKEFFQSDGTAQLVADAGNGLYYTGGDGNWHRLVDGNGTPIGPLNTTQRWDINQMGDILYLANGVDPTIAWDGTRFVPWFEPINPLQLNALGSGSGPAAGTYDYVYTVQYGTEQTGPSPVAAIVLGSGGGVIIQQILTRHVNASYLNIWRTKSNAPGTYYLIRQIPNNDNVFALTMQGPYVNNGLPQTDGGSDGVLDAVLGTGAYIQMPATVQTTKGQNPQYLISNYDRIFMAGMGNAPYEMDWTEPGLPDVRFATSFVTDHGNRKITGLSKLVGEVDAHKDGRGCVVLRGADPSSWTEFEDLHPTLGATSHFGIVYRSIPRGGGAGDDRTEVCIPTPEGWYGYVGYDFYRIDDPINTTFKTLAQSNATRNDFIVGNEAQFQTAVNNGGVVSQNIQNNPYSTDGLRQIPGQVSIVNQLDYLGMWEAGQGLAPGNIIALCPGLADGEMWFSTDANGNLYHTKDNFNTLFEGGPVTTLANPNERIIEIVRKGTVDIFFLITDSNANEVLRATVTVQANGNGTPINVILSNTAQFYNGQYLDFTQVGHAYVPTLPTNIQIPWGLVDPNPEPIQPTYITLTIPNGVVIPVGTEVYQASTMTPDSAGGEIYLLDNTVPQNPILSEALTPTLFYSSDTPFQVFSSHQGTGNPNSVGAEETWIGTGDNTNALFVNHRQLPNITFSGLAYNAQFETCKGNNPPLQVPINVRVVPQYSNPPLNEGVIGIISYLNTTLPALSDFNATQRGLMFIPGFYTLQSWSENPGNSTGQEASSQNVPEARGYWSKFLFQVQVTNREFPAWLGGSYRPQAFWDQNNNQLVFLATPGDDANFNRTSQIATWTQGNGFGFANGPSPVTAMCTDGVQLYFAVAGGAQVGQLGNQTQFYYAPLNDVFAYVWTIPGNGFEIVTRMYYEAASNRIMYFTKTFALQQYYIYSGEISAFSAGDLTTFKAATTLTQLIGLQVNGNKGPYFQEAVRQTDVPDVWVVAVNRIDGEAFYSVKPTLINIFGSTNSDVGILLGPAYVDPASDDVATGICSNLVFVVASGAAGGNLWSDRVYFGVAQELGSPIGLGFQNPVTYIINMGMPVQLGVPGNWTVIGTFQGPIGILPNISGWNSFDATYQGQVAFAMANNNTGAPLGPFYNVPPNRQIVLPSGGAVPGEYVQWLATLTWTYSVAAGAEPTFTPFFSYVDISYFVGQQFVPVVTGIHYYGRSRWSVALAGQTVPSMELVYQKNNTWTMTKGRSIIGYAIFQGNLVCFEGATLLQMETGSTWNGAAIDTLAVTGYIMDDTCDKYLRKIEMNVMQDQNQTYPNQTGYMEFQPLRAGVEVAGSPWFLPIPTSANPPQPIQVQGVMNPFTQVWCRAFALMMATSSDDGQYAPATEQMEDIQAVILTIRKSPPRYSMPVN